jgi:RNA polymerase sigma-70 factor (ECF subfamily)
MTASHESTADGNQPTEELLERLAAGDHEAAEVLLERHLPGLRGFVRLRSGKVLRDRESTSDLVQSVCREVLSHMDRFQYRSEVGFKQWLYTTAMRKISNRVQFYHAQKRDADRERPMGKSTGGHEELYDCYQTFCTPSAELMSAEEIGRIEAAFDELPAEYREVIVLARVMGLSRAEIGAQMGRSEGAVRNLLSRALARLAELLDS